MLWAIVGHPGDVDELLDRGMPQVAQARLGDVHGEVAHALEVGVDLHRGHDGAEVHGHGLMQRQQLEAAVVDLDVELVDGGVAGEHAFERAGVAPDEAVERRAQALLGQATHLEEPRLELVQFFLEVSHVLLVRHVHPYPNRPVT
jgi:hypothetical protein